MFDAPFRGWFARVMSAPVTWLARTPVTPTMLTVGAMGVGVVAALITATGQRRLGIVIWLLSRVLDGMDGMLARARNASSLFGGFLDITLDMVAYGAMLGAFAWLHPGDWAAWLAVMGGYLLVTTSTLALSSGLESIRATTGDDRSLRFTPGLAEAGETSLVYVLLALLPQFAGVVAWTWAGACAVTVVQRTILARRLLTRDGNDNATR